MTTNPELVPAMNRFLLLLALAIALACLGFAA
jgi:hypothetical protein